MARRRGIPGLSFSWKRAAGISAAKRRLSRTIGIPLTRSGRERKIARATGCMVPIAFGAGGLIALGWLASLL
jgi:hypothetical protein